MRIAQVLTLIGTAALSFAASAEPASVNTEASMTAVNVARATYRLHDSDLKAVQGLYALEDGRTLRVSAEQRKLYAEVDGHKSEIVKIGRAKFASRDDAVRVSFDTADSVANDVQVSLAPR